MLARYLRRPVRYAQRPPTDPGLNQALMNFLALNTRGFDLPHFAQQAQPQLQQIGGGRDQQLLQQLLHGTLQGHDPAALAQFLDVHQDLSGRQPPGHDDMLLMDEDDPHGTLINFLHMLHTVGQNFPRNDMGYGLREHYGFPSGEEHPALGYRGHGGRIGAYQHPLIATASTNANAAINQASDESPNRPVTTHPLIELLRGLSNSRSEAAQGRIGGYSGFYDALHRLGSQTASPQIAAHAGRGRQALSQGLRQGVIPLLEGRDPVLPPPPF